MSNYILSIKLLYREDTANRPRIEVIKNRKDYDLPKAFMIDPFRNCYQESFLVLFSW
jgi:hypothetical protein